MDRIITKKITAAIIENTKTVSGNLMLKGERTLTQIIGMGADEMVTDICEADEGDFLLKSGGPNAFLRNFIEKGIADGAVRFELHTMPSYEYSETESVKTTVTK